MSNFKEKAREEGIDVYKLKIGQNKIKCPKCSSDRKNKFDRSLSVEYSNDGIVWTCHHCGWQGGLNDNFTKKEPEYTNVKQFVPKEPTISDVGVEWLNERGISKETIEHFKIYTNNGNLCFPYYFEDQIVNVKSRSKEKRFFQTANAKQTLYNIDEVKRIWDKKPTIKKLIFVEGEMDVLSIFECGYKNVVSLPSGAPKEAKYSEHDKRFKALENSEWIFDADEVIICTDNDTAGKALELELVYRFGKDICKIVKFPHHIKDANECLTKLNETTLQYYIDNAEDFPIEGLHSAKDYHQTVQNIYDGNVQKAISTGFAQLDNIYKIMPQTFNLVTGIPNHGKSNFLDQILINLAENNNWKFAIYSPEHSTPNHIRRLLEKRCRKPFDIGVYERMTQDELNAGIDFLDVHFKFIENTDEIPSIEYILKKAKSAKQKYGINGIVIDPFNQISPERDNNKREDEHIRDIIAKCQKFARNHEVIVWMVAHPHKLHRNDCGVIPPPDLYQVSGSAHWANMADVGLVIHRDFEDNTTQIITRKIREQGTYGNIGMVRFSFNAKKRIYEEIDEDTI